MVAPFVLTRLVSVVQVVVVEDSVVDVAVVDMVVAAAAVVTVAVDTVVIVKEVAAVMEVAKVVDMAVARATGVVVEDTPAVVVTVEASSREAAEDGNKYLRLSPTLRRSDIEKEKSAWVAAKVNCVVGRVGCHLAMAVAGQPRGLWKRVYLGELIRSAWR